MVYYPAMALLEVQQLTKNYARRSGWREAREEKCVVDSNTWQCSCFCRLLDSVTYCYSRRFRHVGSACPKCGGEIHERYKQFQCDKCDFAFWKTLCSRMFEIEEVEKIITDKVIGPLQGFRSKQGFPFAAVLKMNAENEVEGFDFGDGRRWRGGGAD